MSNNVTNFIVDSIGRFLRSLSLRSVHWLSWLIGGIILGLSGEFLYDYLRNVVPSAKPYIAIIMSESSPDSPVSKEFLNGFREKNNKQNFIKAANDEIVNVIEFDDNGNIQDTERITSQLLEDEKCILVVGNSNSTLTSVTLDVFMKSSHSKRMQPPAMILPIATMDKLLERAKFSGYQSILRMPPRDEFQAGLIARLAMQTIKDSSSCRIAIYGDSDNPLYSENLRKAISEKVRDLGAVVLIEEMMGPSQSFYSSISLWQSKYAPNVVIYAGITHHALLLCDLLYVLCRDFGKNVPVIFSDGCMTNKLLTYKRLPGNSFLVSPTKQITENQIPTYEPYGEDACTLTKIILDNVDHCTRIDVARYIEENKNQIRLHNGAVGTYRFDSDGNNTGISFHAYKIGGNKIVYFNLD